MINAQDMSSDLGFGRRMPPAFWRWCRRHGLEPADPLRPLGFDPDDVQRALRAAGVAS